MVDAKVYVIVVVPGAIPVATPDDEPMVPMAVLLLLHSPPGLASLKMNDEPTQMYGAPVIAAGGGLTVNSMVE